MTTNKNLAFFLFLVILSLFYGCKKEPALIIPSTSNLIPPDYSHLEGKFYTQRIKDRNNYWVTSSVKEHLDQMMSISVADSLIQLTNSVNITDSIFIDSVTQTIFKTDNWVLEYHNNYDSISLYNRYSSPYADTVQGIRDDTEQYKNAEKASFTISAPQVINYSLSIHKIDSSGLGVSLDTQYVATLPVQITRLTNTIKFYLDGQEIIVPIQNTYVNERIYNASASNIKQRYSYWTADTLSIEYIEEDFPTTRFTRYYYRGVKN